MGSDEEDKENLLPVVEPGHKSILDTPLSSDDGRAELFAPGEQDSEDSIPWEDGQSDRENRALTFAPDHDPFDTYSGDFNAGDTPTRDVPTPTNRNRGIVQSFGASPSPSTRQHAHLKDDPFGFLAAERRIKQRKQITSHSEAGPSAHPPAAGRRPFGRREMPDLNPTSPPSLPVPTSTAPAASRSRLPPSSFAYARYSDSSIEDLYATPHSAAALIMSTPKKRRSVDDPQTPVVGVMTPRNGNSGREVTMRKRRRKDVDVSFDEESDVGSVPSSPSPVKRTRDSREKEKEQDTEEEENEETEERPAKRLREKGKGKENAVTKAKEDPRAEMRRLEEMLPKRRSKRAAAKGRKKVVEESDEENEDGGEGMAVGRPMRGRSRVRGTRMPRGRGKGRSTESRKGSRKRMEESTPEEVREVCPGQVSPHRYVTKSWS